MIRPTKKQKQKQKQKTKNKNKKQKTNKNKLSSMNVYFKGQLKVLTTFGPNKMHLKI